MAQRTVFAVLTVALCFCRLSGAGLPLWEDHVLASFPEYKPAERVSGTISLWGHGSTKNDFMGKLVARWESGFRPYQPDVRFDYRMYGTASAVGALYTGAGNLAIMGEEVFPFEAAAYEQAMHRPPSQIEVATGSLGVRNFDFAQMFFVHKGNPVAGLTLAQIDAAFGTEHRRGLRNARTWGDLGLSGSWSTRPIHLYGWALDNDFWIYLEQAIFQGSHRLNNSIREYSHIPRPDGTIYDAGQQILEALATDPDGLAISNIRYLVPGVKALPLAARAGGPFVAATEQTLVSRTYPLTRVIPAVFNRPPGAAIEPAVREFLFYLLSREGQGEIAQDGEYLPLSAEAAAAERRKLQ